jgi:hypothetical protein
MQKTFNLARVLLTIGTIPVSGFADGDAIVVAKDSDAWTKTVGADGEVCRHRTNNDSGSITINLSYSSQANGLLDALRALDATSGGGAVPVTVLDLASGTEFFAPSAWIKKAPDATFGREVGPRQWVLDCSRIIERNRGIPGIGARPLV